MPGDDLHQHSFYCTDRLWDSFKRWLSHKYPIYVHGAKSAEISAAIIERMTKEKVETNAHTHKNKHAIPKMEKVKFVPSYNESVQMTTTSMATAIITKTYDGSGDDYHKRPPQDDPTLRQWYMRKGIDLTNIDNIMSHMTEEDYRAGELEGEDYKRWKSTMHGKLAAKLRRAHANNLYSKAKKRKSALESELTELRRILVEGNYIRERKATEDDIYLCWTVVTGLKDRQRVFRNALSQYCATEHLTLVDKKSKIYKVENKLLDLVE